jgi:ATP-dependent RNA helicase RhlE
MTFTSFGLSAPILSVLTEMGYQSPTPIQQQAIPLVMQGRDVFGCAQTGTGKTAAFALQIIHQLIHDAGMHKGMTRPVSALILAPTRELAIQIKDNIASYTRHTPVKHAVVFGGVSYGAQIRALNQGADILIATPGRLMDLMQQGYVHLSQVKFFVLDEADRMLDMGFIHDIRRIIQKLPQQKQTLFFSATASLVIMKLAQGILNNPERVTVSPVLSTSKLINQSVYYVSRKNKRSLLNYLIENQKIEHALVFTRTKRGADRVAKDLNAGGIKAEAIHGDKSQQAREKALSGFKNRRIRILVATDIASRGIDVDKLSHVINYEIPEHAETYVHRIGRTGRAGYSGTAMSLCAEEEVPYLKDIHKLIKQNIEVVAAHPFA